MSDFFSIHLFAKGIFNCLGVISVMGIGFNSPINAQVIPDSSLESESSVVVPGVEIEGETADRIDGGAIRDRNLFHSFSEFNVNEGQRVYFANPANIEQIFTRVTGSNSSNIDGTLGVDGAADLLLLNPNGILFGENSSLDVEGSFFGTSGDSVLFEDGSEFSAVNPASSLLTVSVPLGLQFGNNPGSISVRSPLTVADGQNFSLLGGEINLTGNNVNTDEEGINISEDEITAPGGRVELGSIATTGTVSLEDDGSFSFPGNVARADITLNNFSIDASAGGGGSIVVFSQNLKLINSSIVTGIDFSVESTEAQAGNITIDTVEETTLEATSNSASGIFNLTGDFSELLESTEDIEVINTAGNAGNIFLKTGSLSATGLSFIGSFTNGEGNAGNVLIDARDSISFGQTESLGNSIFSIVGESATGNGADIVINANSLSLSNRVLNTSTTGAGNAGNIELNIADSIELSNNSTIGTGSFEQGNAGNLTINTDKLAIQNSLIDTSNNGLGEAGTLNIIAASSVNISGTPTQADGSPFFSIHTSTFGDADAGDIFIETENFTMTDGAQLQAATIGSGDGGNVNIEAKFVELSGTSDDDIFSGISALSLGSGTGGAITINSDRIIASDGAAILAEARETGNAGSISLDTKELTVDSATISTGNSGTGQAGSLNIIASELVSLNGIFTNIDENQRAAGLFTSTLNGNADAGNVTVNTKVLEISEGARIEAGTAGSGDGGNISIEAEQIQLTGSSGENFSSLITAFTTGSGNGGTINIAAKDLIIKDDAGINLRSIGDGSGGVFAAVVNGSLELDNGFISNRSDRSTGGEITILAGDIRLRGNSSIRTNVNDGEGGGGNITLSADSIVAFDDSDIFAFSADGVGGNITLNTDAFFAANFSSATFNVDPRLLDNNGRVDLNASGFVSGIIDIPDVNFLPNSLVELSEDTIDADEVVANSCVVRNNRQGGTFIVTGSDSLPSRPGDPAMADYSTGKIRAIPDSSIKTRKDNWQPGDPITEPDQVYRLSNGKLVLSRGCN